MASSHDCKRQRVGTREGERGDGVVLVEKLKYLFYLRMLLLRILGQGAKVALEALQELLGPLAARGRHNSAITWRQK